MDERMLNTGTVPVADQLNRLPPAANGESTSSLLLSRTAIPNPNFTVKAKPQTEEDDEEAELEKLRAEMAMG